MYKFVFMETVSPEDTKNKRREEFLRMINERERNAKLTERYIRRYGQELPQQRFVYLKRHLDDTVESLREMKIEYLAQLELPETPANDNVN